MTLFASASRGFLLALALLAAVGVTRAAVTVTVTDDRGVAVTLAATNYPASVRQVTKTGGLDDANVELIVALKPDLVLLAISSRVTDRLEALGIKVLALEPRTYADVQRVAGKVSQALGQGAAGERLWQSMEAKVNEAARTVPAAARGMTVYYEVDSAPYAAGESSFIGHTLSRLGAVNIVPSKLGPFPKLNPEFVVRADPQLIMVSAKSAPGLGSRPGWRGIRAVKNQHVCVFSPDQGDVLSRPGPRMGEAAQIMAACLRDAVRDPAVANGVSK